MLSGWKLRETYTSQQWRQFLCEHSVFLYFSYKRYKESDILNENMEESNVCCIGNRYFSDFFFGKTEGLGMPYLWLQKYFSSNNTYIANYQYFFLSCNQPPFYCTIDTPRTNCGKMKHGSFWPLTLYDPDLDSTVLSTVIVSAPH